MKILLVVLFLGVVIFVHELGHFSVAKLFKVKVLEFALGFGPKLIKKTIGETEYSIRALPLGGLVRMAGDDPEGELDESDKGRTFLEKPAWQKILIVLAGPVANLLLPIALYFTVLASTQEGTSTLIGYVAPESPAAKAGLAHGDKIIAINGEPTVLFAHLSKIVHESPGKKLELLVLRGEEKIKLDIVPEVIHERDILGKPIQFGRIGIMSSYRRPDVGVMAPGTPAALAGIRTWDRLLELNGKKMEKWEDVVAFFAAGVSGEVRAVISRPKEISAKGLLEANRERLELTIEIPPEQGEITAVEQLGLETSELYVALIDEGLPAAEMGLKKGDRLLSIDGRGMLDETSIGAALRPARERPVEIEWRSEGEIKKGELQLALTEVEAMAKVKVPDYSPGFGTFIERFPTEIASHRLSPLKAAKEAVVETAEKTALIVVALGSMFKGEVPLDQIGGPIMLYKISSEAADRGIAYFFSIIAFISINLGLINLFPVPILDGGLIVLFTVEAAIRRPIPPRVRYAMNAVGLFLLVSLMLYAIKNDVIRYWFTS